MSKFCRDQRCARVAHRYGYKTCGYDLYRMPNPEQGFSTIHVFPYLRSPESRWRVVTYKVISGVKIRVEAEGKGAAALNLYLASTRVNMLVSPPKSRRK